MAHVKRGRPRKQVDPADSSTNDRRENNRIAQKIFRARRRAELTASEDRVQELEGCIEKLGEIFLSLTNHVLKSSLAMNDPALVQGLRGSIKAFLSLTEGLSKSEDGHPPSISATSPLTSALQPSHRTIKSKTEMAEEPEPVTPASSHTPAGIGLESGQNQEHELGSPPCEPPLDIQVPVPPEPAPKNSIKPINLFGNGWGDNLPMAYTVARDANIGIPLPPDSLRLRIIQATIHYGYHILMETSNPWHGSAGRIFNNALRFQSRDQILFCLRWFLGPGYGELYRLTEVQFNAPPFKLPEMPSPNPAVDQGATSSTSNITPQDPTSQGLFVNAGEVETYLKSMGAHRISDDIFKVDYNAEGQPNRIESTTPRSTQQPSIFFPSPSSDTTPKKVEVPCTTGYRHFSERVFLRLLVEVSSCLTYGPGYQMELLNSILIRAVNITVK